MVHIEHENNDSYQELSQMMLSSNPQVKFGATNAILSMSEDRDLVDYVSSAGSAILRNLLRNFESEDKQLVLTALSALINLSGNDSVVDALIPFRGIERIVNSLNARQLYVQMHCALLGNLTRTESGIKQALTIPNLFKGVFLKYCADSEEHTDSLGLVVINCTADPAIRGEICRVDEVAVRAPVLERTKWDYEDFDSSDDEEQAQPETPTTIQRCLLLECLARLFPMRRRRVVTLRTVRNLALDPNCHQAMVIARLAAKMGAFLYPISGEGEYARRSAEAAEEFRTSESGLAADIETRVVAAEILFCLTRSRDGRVGMREQGVYEFVRLWHLQEQNEELKDRLEMIANIVHLTESEIERGELDGASEHLGSVPLMGSQKPSQ